MNRPITLAVDLDNVCVNTTECMINYINKLLPVNLKMEDITTYSIEAALPKQYQWIVEKGFRDKDMWKNIELISNCAKALEILNEENFKIVFATSSLPENLRKKINHLSRNLSFFPEGYVEKNTININDKYLLNVDILVDDCAKHITHTERKYNSIVFDYPWNRDIIEAPRIFRAYNWTQIYNYCKMIQARIYDREG